VVEFLNFDHDRWSEGRTKVVGREHLKVGQQLVVSQLTLQIQPSCNGTRNSAPPLSARLRQAIGDRSPIAYQDSLS
jgi:hypothetical protein